MPLKLLTAWKVLDDIVPFLADFLLHSRTSTFFFFLVFISCTGWRLNFTCVVLQVEGMPRLDFLPVVSGAFWFLELAEGSLTIASLQIASVLSLIAFHIWSLFFVYENEDGSETNYVEEWVHYLWIVLHLHFIVTDIFIIVAYVDRTQKNLLFTSVCLQITLIILYMLMAIFLFILMIVNNDILRGILIGMFRMILFAVWFYCVLIVHSWYKTFKSDTDKKD